MISCFVNDKLEITLSGSNDPGLAKVHSWSLPGETERYLQKYSV